MPRYAHDTDAKPNLNEVEYAYPPLIAGNGEDSSECPAQWKHLPSLALPDGAHNFKEDTVFFHLPSRDDNKTTVYGVSCYRQMDSTEVLNRGSDVTRNSVQKSVCVLSKLPAFGLIQAKLEMITHAYFKGRDFTQVELLRETFATLNHTLTESLLQDSQIFLGLSCRELLQLFQHKILILFKLVLLERRILFYSSPVKSICTNLLTTLSLFPGMIEHGLTEAVCHTPPRPLSPTPSRPSVTSLPLTVLSPATESCSPVDVTLADVTAMDVTSIDVATMDVTSIDVATMDSNNSNEVSRFVEAVIEAASVEASISDSLSHGDPGQITTVDFLSSERHASGDEMEFDADNDSSRDVGCGVAANTTYSSEMLNLGNSGNDQEKSNACVKDNLYLVDILMQPSGDSTSHTELQSACIVQENKTVSDASDIVDSLPLNESSVSDLELDLLSDSAIFGSCRRSPSELPERHRIDPAVAAGCATSVEFDEVVKPGAQGQGAVTEVGAQGQDASTQAGAQSQGAPVGAQKQGDEELLEGRDDDFDWEVDNLLLEINDVLDDESGVKPSPRIPPIARDLNDGHLCAQEAGFESDGEVLRSVARSGEAVLSEREGKEASEGQGGLTAAVVGGFKDFKLSNLWSGRFGREQVPPMTSQDVTAVSSSSQVSVSAEEASSVTVSQRSLVSESPKPVVVPSSLAQDEFGFPLAVFTEGVVCHPYASLQLYDLLKDPSVRGLVLGASNALFRQRNNHFDVVVEPGEARIEIPDAELRRQVALTTADLRFADFLVKSIGDERGDIFLDDTGWEGGDDWLRSQFKTYLLSMLAAVALDNEKLSEDFNSSFTTAWRGTHNFKAWASAAPHPGMDGVAPEHPFHGQLSMADVRLKLAQAMQSVDKNKKINSVVTQTGQAVTQTSKAVGVAVMSAKSAVLTWFGGFSSPKS